MRGRPQDLTISLLTQEQIELIENMASGVAMNDERVIHGSFHEPSRDVYRRKAGFGNSFIV